MSGRVLAGMATLSVIVIGAGLVVLGAGGEDGAGLPFPDGQPARQSDTFVDSVGVNTHLHYGSTPYAQFDRVEALLGTLGVRHVRDYPVPESVDEFEVLADEGIRLTAIMGVPSERDWMPHDLTELLDAVAELGAGVVALEGANEWDISDDPDWTTNLRSHQRSIWERTRSEADRVALVAPSITWAENMPEIGDLGDWADIGNIHPYPGGRAPEARVADDVAAVDAVVPGGSVVATETGYHDESGGDWSHRGVSPETAAVYLPRLLLHYYDIGITRTFIYELLDQADDAHPESSFGLVGHDFRPKPAFESVRALLAMLEDPGPAFEPGRLDYELDHGGDVRDVLFQSRDGTFHLAVWRETSIWDPNAGRAVPDDARRGVLTVADPIGEATVTTFGPAGIETERIDDPARIPLEIGAEVQVIRLEPEFN